MASYIDLTHVIGNGTAPYPGDPAPGLRPVATVASDGYALESVGLSTHTATHIDGPAHMFENGIPLQDFDPGAFTGPAVVVDAPGPEIGHEALARAFSRHGQPGGMWVLLRTGWSRHWADPATYFHGRWPTLTSRAVGLLIDHGVRGIGLDTPGPDALDSGPANHRELLSHGILIVENLTGLGQLPADRIFEFAAWPLKLASADGAPVRAVARIDRQG